MHINIIGNGTVGNTLVKWVQNHLDDCKVSIYDPGQNKHDDLTYAQATFIAVPVPVKGMKQDLTILEESIKRTNKNSLIFVRSTVLPGTCEKLTIKHERIICSMPEFLTERRAYRDFCYTKKTIVGLPFSRNDHSESTQKLIKQTEDIVLNFLTKLFRGKKTIEILMSGESEMTKYIHNCFGAFKVTYFNTMRHLCEINNIEFDYAMRNIFETGFINKEHTMVPGPDGKMGYGGKCFPENIDSMIGFCNSDVTGQLFKDIHLLNKYFRYGNEKYDKKQNIHLKSVSTPPNNQ